MQVLTILTLYIIVILSYASLGSSRYVQKNSKLSRKSMLQAPSYSKLLELMKSRQQYFNERDDENEDDNKNQEQVDGGENYQDKLLEYLQQNPGVEDMIHQLPDSEQQEVLLNPEQRETRGNRPSYNYGRKSHWDTLFG